MVQWVTDDAFMGRVNSVINTSMAVMMIVSLISGGALTDLFGVRQVIGGAALLFVASGTLSLLLIRVTPVPRHAPIEDGVRVTPVLSGRVEA
jgi:MFS family permease